MVKEIVLCDHNGLCNCIDDCADDDICEFIRIGRYIVSPIYLKTRVVELFDSNSYKINYNGELVSFINNFVSFPFSFHYEDEAHGELFNIMTLMQNILDNLGDRMYMWPQSTAEWNDKTSRVDKWKTDLYNATNNNEKNKALLFIMFGLFSHLSKNSEFENDIELFGLNKIKKSILIM